MKDLLHCINESKSDWESLPKVQDLPDGQYEGYIWGSMFHMKNGEAFESYTSPIGMLNMWPIECTIEVKDKDVKFVKEGKYQIDPRKIGLK